MHVFPEDRWEILESEERRKSEPPERIEDLLKKVDRREVAFDVGAGTGYFTEVLSKHFRRVYAVERSEKLAYILHSKGLKNVGVIVSDKPPEIDFEIDLVLFADSLHEIACKEDYAEWCKKSRYLIVIDWRKDKCMDVGPPQAHRLDVKQVKELFDFEFEEYEIYPCHFVLFGRTSTDRTE